MTHIADEQSEVTATAANTIPQPHVDAETADAAPKVTPPSGRSLEEEFEAVFGGPRALGEEPNETITARMKALRRRIEHLRKSSAPGKGTVDINKPETLDQPCRVLLEKIKVELTQQHDAKPLRDFFRFDALITREPEAGVDYNSSGITDEDGDCINCEREYERRNTGSETVRMQVPVGIAAVEVVRVLRKTADWIESRPDLLADFQ